VTIGLAVFSEIVLKNKKEKVMKNVSSVKHRGYHSALKCDAAPKQQILISE